MILTDWARAWGVSPRAVHDLRKRLGTTADSVTYDTPDTPESEVQARVRLEAAKRGERLWRNNSGAVETTDGRFIRYGLCNDSKRVNEQIKSSDLIGIKPVVVMPHMVGTVVGIFKAREVKRGGWTYSGKKREEAQLKFIQLVNSMGGDAAFTNGRTEI